MNILINKTNEIAQVLAFKLVLALEAMSEFVKPTLQNDLFPYNRLLKISYTDLFSTNNHEGS